MDLLELFIGLYFGDSFLRSITLDWEEAASIQNNRQSMVNVVEYNSVAQSCLLKLIQLEETY